MSETTLFQWQNDALRLNLSRRDGYWSLMVNSRTQPSLQTDHWIKLGLDDFYQLYQLVCYPQAKHHSLYIVSGIDLYEIKVEAPDKNEMKISIIWNPGMPGESTVAIVLKYEESIRFAAAIARECF